MANIFVEYIVIPMAVPPILVGIINYKFLPNTCRFLLGYLVLSLITNEILIFLSSRHLPNLLVIRVYTVGEFLLLGSFFFNQFRGSFLMRRVVLLSLVLFPVVSIVISLFQDVSLYDSYAASLEAILINCFSVALFSKESEKAEQTPWADNPTNWFNTGILLYFAGAMCFFLFSNQILKLPHHITTIIWNAHATLLLSLYVLFIIGFLKCKTRTQN